MNTTTLMRWASAHSPWSYIGASAALLVALVLLLVGGLMVRNAVRGAGRGRGITGLINLAALLATSVQASGMWKFFGNTMGLSTGFRVLLFGFMEIAVLACGLRARDNVEKGDDAGIDGFLVVALALASGVMSSTDAASAQEVLMRVLVSVVVALLWTRDLMAAKRKARAAGGARRSGPVRWRITPERVFVWLRLADAVDTDVSTVEAGRRVSRYLRATDRAARSWRRPWSPEARADRARMRLTQHALMHGDPTGVHEQLADSAFTDALRRLGIGASESQGVDVSETASGMQSQGASRARIPGASGADQGALVMPQRRRIRKASGTASGSASEARLKADALDLDRASIAETNTPAGLRQLQRELGIGQARATELRAWLAAQREQLANVEHANGHAG